MSGATSNLSLETSVKPGTSSDLVLGIASCGTKTVAVGGQGRDLFLASDDGDRFAKKRSLNGGLRNAWLTDSCVWVVGEYGYAARSTDGAGTWEKISTGKWKPHRGPCLFGIVQDVEGVFWLAGDGGFLMRSTDGAVFTKIRGTSDSIGRITSTSMGVLIPTDEGHVFVAEGKKIRKLGAKSDASLMIARVTHAGSIVVVGSKGTVIRSTDHGDTFASVETPARGLIAGLDVLADGRLVMCADRGGVFVSNDDGESFEALAQHVSTAQLWCVKRYGSGALIGGTAGTILRLKNAAMDDVWDDIPKSPHVPTVVAVHQEPAPPANPLWRAPPLSTARQTWKPKSLPLEKKKGVLWSPTLRALVHPRRGGIETSIRPLPTIDEAWARFRRAIWADDQIGMERKKALSTIWSWVTSFDGAFRKMGERVLDVEPRRGDLDENVALAKATLGRYGQFPANFHHELWESLADFFVASSGLVETIRAAYLAIDNELPYMQMGLFARLRELLVLADDASYADARNTILESHETEVAKSKGSTHREPDLKWTTTFLLPLGPAAKDEEKRIHADALSHLSKFGDFGQHAAGLAAGDASTLERFLRANQGVRHEFFAGSPRRYIAAMLDVDPDRAAPLLAKMKLASPFEDSAAENTKWMEIVAHIDHEDALEAMWQERHAEVSATWGNAALLTAARLNFDRVLQFAKRTKNDDELVMLIEKERGKTPDEPDFVLSEPTVEPLAKPTDYVPPTPTHPTWLKNPLGIEPEVSWRDGETENVDYSHDHVTWNGGPIQKCTPAAIDELVVHAEKWALPSYLNVIALTPSRVHPRLFALGFDMRQAYWARSCLRPIVVKDGVASRDVLVACLQTDATFEDALVPVQGIGDVSIAPSMIDAFAGKKYKAAARSWMLRHPRHSVAGALEMFGKDAASRALRFLDAQGHRDLIVDFATRMNVKGAVIEMLDRDPLTQPKVKKPVVPQYVDASKLPKLAASSGKNASHEEVTTLLVELAFSNADEIHPGVLAAKRAYTKASRAAFAWGIFEAWLVAGADPKASWCMQSVGFLGDDDAARKLAALAKLWPGQGFGARAQSALDALLNIGTDAALVNINILAEKSRFPAFKQAAAERILAIADARGLTTDELADRLVPTLGLDEEGGGELDFGARKFTVAFDAQMLPVVRDASGAIHADLPKPSKTDDAAKAKAAKAKFSGLKKDAKATASLQVSRMERAMKSGRRIDRALFLEVFAAHPWMRHLAERLVWGAHGASGEIIQLFRVAEDGTLANEQDAEYKLPIDASVSVVHPKRKNLQAWSSRFAEYRIIQPFPQIARPTFEPTEKERGARALERFRGKKTSYGALRGLESRGWQRWTDDAVVFAKPIGPNRKFAELETDPGWHPSQTADDIEPQTIGDVRISSDLTFGAVDPVIFSELLYDLELLT